MLSNSCCVVHRSLNAPRIISRIFPESRNIYCIRHSCFSVNRFDTNYFFLNERRIWVAMHDKGGQLYNVSQSKIQLGTRRVVCAVTLYIYTRNWLLWISDLVGDDARDRLFSLIMTVSVVNYLQIMWREVRRVKSVIRRKCCEMSTTLRSAPLRSASLPFTRFRCCHRSCSRRRNSNNSIRTFRASMNPRADFRLR